jgi:hypothetical protein
MIKNIFENSLDIVEENCKIYIRSESSVQGFSIYCKDVDSTLIARLEKIYLLSIVSIVASFFQSIRRVTIARAELRT